MDDIKHIAEKIGYATLAEKLGVGETAISNAVTRGYFPSTWYKVVTHLGATAGVPVPDHLFNFKDVSDKS